MSKVAGKVMAYDQRTMGELEGWHAGNDGSRGNSGSPIYC